MKPPVTLIFGGSPQDGSTLTPERLTAALLVASRNLLAKIDNMTTEEFQLGGERAEREARRAVIDKFAELAAT